MSDFLVGSALWLDLPTARKMVLVSLCENADKETGACFPGQEYIAARCSLTARSVRDHLAALEKAGYIETLSVGHGFGSVTKRLVAVDRIESEGSARKKAFGLRRRTQRDARIKAIRADAKQEESSALPRVAAAQVSGSKRKVTTGESGSPRLTIRQGTTKGTVSLFSEKGESLNDDFADEQGEPDSSQFGADAHPDGDAAFPGDVHERRPRELVFGRNRAV
ncbi:MAG: helix-turn-helix domain-containing protein [Hyphomicrobiaceae bacterium]